MEKTVKLISKNFNCIDPESIEDYRKTGGYESLKKAMEGRPEEVIEVITRSGLSGRGGAAYPTGIKWAQSAAVKGDRKVIICNADEGEPCTFKDRHVLEYDPFKIIEGMTIAAFTVGATEGYIYVREEYTWLQKRLKNVIKKALSEGFLGHNILGKGLTFTINVISGAGAYVCGENSSLIESIEGRSGRPKIKPPYIKECGLFNLPTLVNNVETFAIIPVILSEGFNEYIQHGTEFSKGTKLISMAGNIRKPGVYEIPFGLTLREIVEDVGGGIPNGRKLKFLQIGGASGPLIPQHLLDVRYCYEDLKKNYLSIGSGAILVADDTNSVVDFIKSVQDFFFHESCGKCTPCREGNRQLTKIINRMVQCNATWEDFKTVERFAVIMKHASFCGLGKAAPTALISAIRHFPEEFQSHIEKVAGACALYME